MSKVVQTNGNISLIAGEEQTILLDTGSGVGTTRVTGNLIVDGDTLTVSAEDLQVQDNIITLNFGETGDGVSLRYSGLEIDRGTAGDGNSTLAYDEQSDTWFIANGSPDNYSFSESNLRVKRIRTDADSDNGDLTLIGFGTGVVKVLGTNNYENQVTDDDDIPNKKYVDDAIQNQPARQITTADTKVIASDADEGDLDYLGGVVLESEVAVLIDNTISATFYGNRAEIQDLEILGSEITNNNTNDNIALRTNNTGKIEFNSSAMIIEHSGSTPANTLGYTTLHANPINTGGTGLYFVGPTTNGEIISKDRALLFSMMF